MITATNQVMTQQGIKALHLKQIYLHCLHSGGISRAQLRREMGLSFSAVSALVDELIAGNILEEIGIVEKAKRGRPSILLRICADRFSIPVVAMTVDGYYCKLFNFVGEEQEACFIPYGFDADTVKQFNGRRHPDFDSLAGPLIQWVNDLKLRSNPIAFVMTAPGSVSKDGVLSSSSARIATPVGFHSKLEDAVGLELYLGNPSDHYAYAEYHYNRDAENFALILIGNGVGAAFVRNGMLFETKPRRAGEFGHISIDYKGRPCICGGCGCLERYISTTAMAEDAGMDYETLCQRYLIGDPLISEFIRQKADALAMGISNMLTMHPVQQIVLGGEIRKLGQPFLEALRDSMQRVGFRRLMQNLEVRYSLGEEKTEILGALWNFIENQLRVHSIAD